MIPAEVWDVIGCHPGRALALVHLLRRQSEAAGEPFECATSELADASGLTPSSVKRLISRLEATGWLWQSGRRNAPKAPRIMRISGGPQDGPQRDRQGQDRSGVVGPRFGPPRRSLKKEPLDLFRGASPTPLGSGEDHDRGQSEPAAPARTGPEQVLDAWLQCFEDRQNSRTWTTKSGRCPGYPRGKSRTRIPSVVVHALAEYSVEECIGVVQWAFLCPDFGCRTLRGENPGQTDHYLDLASLFRVKARARRVAQAQAWIDNGAPTGSVRRGSYRPSHPKRTASPEEMANAWGAPEGEA